MKKKKEVFENIKEMVVETDETHPKNIATITEGNVKLSGGYRVRFTPNYKKPKNVSDFALVFSIIAFLIIAFIELVVK